MSTVKASELTAGMVVDMEPVFVDFDETEAGDYLVAQTEYALVESVEFFEGFVIIGFENLGSWSLPSDYSLIQNETVVIR